MNQLEIKLHERNPRITPRPDFVSSVMKKLPEKPDEIKKSKVLLRFLSVPLSAALAGVATFAVLAFFVLPNVSDMGKPKDPEVARDTDTEAITDAKPVEGETLSPYETVNLLPLEQEIGSIEEDAKSLDADISSLQNELNDDVLGLN